MKLNDLTKNSKGDMVIPVKYEPGKAAMLKVANSDIYGIVGLKKPEKYETEPEVEGGQDWEAKVKYIEGASKAEMAYQSAIGKPDKEVVNEKYRNL